MAELGSCLDTLPTHLSSTSEALLPIVGSSGESRWQTLALWRPRHQKLVWERQQLQAQIHTRPRVGGVQIRGPGQEGKLLLYRAPRQVVWALQALRCLLELLNSVTAKHHS